MTSEYCILASKHPSNIKMQNMAFIYIKVWIIICVLYIFHSWLNLTEDVLISFLNLWSQCLTGSLTAAADVCLTCALRLADVFDVSSVAFCLCCSGDAGLVGLASFTQIQHVSSHASVCVFTPRCFSLHRLNCDVQLTSKLTIAHSVFPFFSPSCTHLTPCLLYLPSTWGKVLCKTHLFLIDFLMNFLAAY